MKNLAQLFLLLFLFLGMFDKTLTVGENVQHVGCFDLNYALSMSYHRHMPDITFNKCITLCSYRATKYAGIEHSDNFCYCGSDIAENSMMRSDDMCNVKCPDNSTAMCGGDWLMSVYSITDFNRDHISTTTTSSPKLPKDNSQDVGFLIGLSNGVIKLNSSNLSTADTVMVTLDWVYSVDYHLSKQLAFAYVKRRIYKSSLTDKKSASVNPSTLSVVRAVGTCDGFAVDWEKDRLYWANCEPGGVNIMSCDLSGNNETTHLMRPAEQANIKNMNIDPYEKMLFWTADGVIESCSLSGSGFKTNMTDAESSTVRALTLDLAARRVFYTSTDSRGPTLHSMDYLGDDPREHFRIQQLKSVYGMGVFKGYVYWINFANSNDIIYQAPINTTSVGQVVLVKIIERVVWHMKLVHPELQEHPGFNPCSNKGCSHECIVLPSHSARCLCPLGMQLDIRGIKCISITQSTHRPFLPPLIQPTGGRERTVDDRSTASQTRTRTEPNNTSTLLVVLSVGSVFLILGLLYLGTHHWPSIQAKLSNVPYRRQEQNRDRGVNPQFDTTGDSVNLI